MCGIAGLIHRGKSSNVGSELQGMLQALKHRGEDSTGYALYGDTDGKNFIMRFKVGENVGEGSSSVMEDVSVYDERKKVVGYGLAAMVAYIAWILVSKFINEKFDEVDEKWIGFWRNAVWVSSGWLWWVWLSHDVANIAVYLPRQLDLTLLLIVMAYFTSLLFYIFYIQGGPIQKVVLEKTGTRYARSATIINVIYAAVLFYFKELNDLPMSTTWVFVGLLCGRELAISTMNKDYKFKYVFPLIGKDFLKMIFGLSVSVGIVLAIHYIIIPNNWF